VSRKRCEWFGWSIRRNPSCLLLGFIFLFGAGEEVSWGQRELHFKTPDFLESNRQKEANIHNLPVFELTDLQGAYKTGLAKYLSMQELFKLFWLTFCFLLPLWSILSRRFKLLLERGGVPIVPLWAGVFLLLNYGLYLNILPMVSSSLKWPVTEIYECFSEFMLAVVAFWVLVQYWGEKGE